MHGIGSISPGNPVESREDAWIVASFAPLKRRLRAPELQRIRQRLLSAAVP